MLRAGAHQPQLICRSEPAWYAILQNIIRLKTQLSETALGGTEWRLGGALMKHFF